MKNIIFIFLLFFYIPLSAQYDFGSYNYGSYGYGDKSLGVSNLIVPGGAKAACYAKFGIIGTDTCWLDISGHGRHAKIHYAKRFINTAEWTANILPYASEVLVEFPSSLLSFDLDSFMFDGNLSARKIPPISMFQNIDYGNKLYCKEISQVLNSDSTEVHGFGVRYFTVYESVQTGANLTAANNWFGVPAKATAKWVAKNGADAAGRGGESNPYLTIAYASSAISAGGTIYIKSGSYTEVTGGFGVVVSKELHYKGIGRAKLIYIGTSTFMYCSTSSANTSFERLIFSPSAAATPVILMGTATSTNIDVLNCRFEGSPTNYFDNAGYSTGVLRYVRNNVFVGSSTYLIYNETSSTIICEGNYIGGSISQSLIPNVGKTNFKYNKVNINIGATKYLLTVTNADIKFNDITLISNCQGALLDAVTSSPHTINIIGNKIKSTYTLATALIYFIQATNGTYIISGNNIYLQTGNGIQLRNCNFDISNNFITINSTPAVFPIAVTTTTFTPTIKTIHNNRIYSASTSYLIDLGTESTTTGDNLIDGATIYNNYCDNIGAGAHVIFCGFCKNTKMYNNYVLNSGYGFVVKGNEISTNNQVYSNIIKNCTIGLISSARRTLFYNNTYKSDLLLNNAPFTFIGSNRHGDSSYISNNIFVLTGANTYVWGAVNSDDGNIIDYNVYYSQVSPITFSVDLTTKSYAQWQALEYDTHSLNQNPNFKSSIELWPIPAITGGTSLGAPYNIGLDISTNWGTSTQLPIIVAKQNTTQIGAYIQ